MIDFELILFQRFQNTNTGWKNIWVSLKGFEDYKSQWLVNACNGKRN